MINRQIYVGCAWCKTGIVELSKDKMIADIEEFVVTDSNVWGGYVCDECVEVNTIEQLLVEMGEQYRADNKKDN